MYHLPRSLTLSKRDFESDTWLIIGITAAVFAFLSSLGIIILCYRRRGHKRRMDKKRITAAKTRGSYAQLDEEKGDSEEEEVPLGERTNVGSPRITPPPAVERIRSQSQSQLQSQPQSNSSSILTPPVEFDRRRSSSPQPKPRPQFNQQTEPQTEYAGVTLRHPQPQGVYLPPTVSDDRGRHLSLRAEYDHDYNYHDDDYDGRTGHRYERDRSPSPGPLVLSRSISMLRPREQSQSQS